MAGNQGILKQINRMAIVRTVRAQPGIVRSEISEATGLADSTISVLVNGLLDEGWLRSSEPVSTGRGAGRRPTRLALDPERLTLLGAEIGVDYLAITACDLNGKQLFSRVQDYVHVEEARSVADAAVLIAEFQGRVAGLGRELLGIGVGVPGMLTPQGVLRVSPNLGWREAPFVEEIAAALARVGAAGVPLTTLNDARARAMSHYMFGHLGTVPSLVYLNVGIGVGAGIVIDDRLLQGHEGFSGEVGHSILEPGGFACACGREGCAEALLSLKGVSRLVAGHEAPVLTIEQLQQRLARGDDRVRNALRVAGQHLGLVAHNLIVTINPAVVIVGGPLSDLQPFMDAALESLKRLGGKSTSHHALMRTCSFGATAGAVGAAASVFYELLHPVAHPAAVPPPASRGTLPEGEQNSHTGRPPDGHPGLEAGRQPVTTT